MAELISALSVSGVSKHFGGVTALADVNWEVPAGEVHGLVGENGSGKSSLVKIISGYYSPDTGNVRIWGQELTAASGTGDSAAGVAVVHQDLGLVPSLSVVDNFGVSTNWRVAPLSRISWRQARRRCQTACAELGLNLNPRALVEALPPAERAMLAIARAVDRARRADGRCLLLLDEPTAYLAPTEVDRVIDVMTAVAAHGSTVIFITHKLGEVIRVCTQATVLRGGQVVGTVTASQSSASQILELMLGRDIGSFYPEPLSAPAPGDFFQLDHLSGNTVHDLSLSVAAGEVVGVTGLAGMGQDEVPYLIIGAQPRASGVVRFLGRPASWHGPAQASAAGVVMVPANRQRDGLWLEASASENVSLPVLNHHFSRGVLRHGRATRRTAELMREFAVRPEAPSRPARTFSGGNQQKLVLAKWLQQHPKLLLLHEPTQGVDLGARKEILAIIQQAAAQGAGVVIFSAEYEQLAHICHRVIVLQDGLLATELVGSHFTEMDILQACHGEAA